MDQSSEVSTLGQLKIAVSGVSGLVGGAVAESLAVDHHVVARLVRHETGQSDQEIHWNPDTQQVDVTALDGMDAVVHLAGENIASGRWTVTKKARIRDSRVEGTRLLSETLVGLPRPPSLLVVASAIGYYGDRGDRVLDEGADAGEGFLSDVCQQWEAACETARNAGIRVVNLRFGVILSPHGGALAKMLLPFKLGVGGIIGKGRQYMSWVALDDVVGALKFSLVTDSLQGPVNVVAPQPVTNRQFTKTLGRVLGRPTILPMPALAARLAFGEMAEPLLLASTRVQPAKLEEAGFKFRYPELKPALEHLLGLA